MEAINVINQLISIIEIHSKATNNNFAWAELELAKEYVSKHYIISQFKTTNQD